MLKSLNGCLSYGTGNRPDVAGKVATSQQNSGKDANIRDLKFANRIIKEMRDHDGPHELWYPRFGKGSLKITGVFDASTGRSVEQRYGQLAYVILLGPRHSARDVGCEMCHVPEFSTKKAKRVTKSSFSGEVQAAVRCSEALHRISLWLYEIEHGAASVSELMSEHRSSM